VWYHPTIVQFNTMNQNCAPCISVLINRISVYIRHHLGWNLRGYFVLHLPKLPKHYHAAQGMHTYILVCLRALCGEYMLGLLLILISKSWGCPLPPPPPPPWAEHAFPRQQHMRRRGGGYLFLLGFSSLYDAIHGWMDGSNDEKNSRKTTTTSFTICNK
jgi:hypothetical protein